MLGFEVYVNNTFLCRAGILSQHMLLLTLFRNEHSPSEKGVSFSVKGFNWESLINKSTSSDFAPKVNKEYFGQMVKSIVESGLYQWTAMDLPQQFKLDIKIVEIEDEAMISPFETVNIDINDVSKIHEIFPMPMD